MANFLYSKAAEAFGGAAINWGLGTFRVALVAVGGTNYVANSVTDQFLSIVPSTSLLATSSTMVGLGTSLGTLTASSVTFVAPTNATYSIGALVIYSWTGTAATSPVVAYIDNYSTLPMALVGANVTVTWPTTGILIL